MSLFSYLNYDGSYTDNILNSVRLMSGKERSEEELNKLLESGSGVYYLTNALKSVNYPEEADYMILDTHFPIMKGFRAQAEAELGDTVCICITKAGLIWQGGFVSSYKKLTEFICTKQGGTPKLKKACKANISLYLAEAKRFMETNPQIMEEYLKLENVNSENVDEVTATEESEAVVDAVVDAKEEPKKKASTARKKSTASKEESTENESVSTSEKETDTKKVATAKKTTNKVTVKKAVAVNGIVKSAGRSIEDKPIFIPDSVAAYVERYMLDNNEYWTLDRIKIVLWRTFLVALKELDAGRESGCVRAGDNIAVNSGFIGDDYQYIIMTGKVFEYNGEHLVKDIAVARSKDDMMNLGFKTNIVIQPVSEAVREKVTHVDFSDRSKMVHCVEERGFRFGIDPLDLNTVLVRSTVERIKASVELSLSLEDKGIKMLIPFMYFTGNGSIQYVAPIYKDMIPKLDAPDGAVIIGKKNGNWAVETAIDLNMALSNVVVLDKYVNTPWLSISKASTY